MSLPPCVCPDPCGPGDCTCVQSRQWVGHSPHAGLLYSQTLHAQPRDPHQYHSLIALTTLHHAPHESHASHESRNFHGTHTFSRSSIQNTIFSHIPYNNISPTHIYQSQFYYFHSSPHVAPVIPSPSKGRKRKSKAAG